MPLRNTETFGTDLYPPPLNSSLCESWKLTKHTGLDHYTVTIVNTVILSCTWVGSCAPHILCHAHTSTVSSWQIIFRASAPLVAKLLPAVALSRSLLPAVTNPAGQHFYNSRRVDQSTCLSQFPVEYFLSKLIHSSSQPQIKSTIQPVWTLFFLWTQFYHI